jgi:pilus assembly protein CpaE
MGIRRVLLLTNELATVTAVSAALESNGKLDPADVCRDLGVLAARLEREDIPAVLVDIDSQPRQILSDIEPLARRFGQTRFVVLSQTLDSTVLLDAMQAGARHCMVKQSVTAELNGVLHRLCPPSGQTRRGGAVTILSAGGGCGATTIAVNLAAEVPIAAELSYPSSSLIVDFDQVYGSAGTYLGVDADYGVYDLLDRDGPIDAQLVTSTSVAQPGQPAALLSVPRSRLGQDVRNPDPRRVGQLLDACKTGHAWTFVDAARVSTPVAVALAAQSDVTVLVMQLILKDIRVAHSMLQSLTRSGMQAGSVQLVINRYRRRGAFIGLEEAREAMKLEASAEFLCLSNDYQAACGAINLGKPLAQFAPRSEFRRDLQKLARRIIAARPASATTSAGGRFG